MIQLEDFLLELRKGFAFIGRQYRITVANSDQYINIKLYQLILKCTSDEYVLGIYEAEQSTAGDTQLSYTLANSKNELQIKYAINHTDSKLFVQKYQLYLLIKDE